jgi:hypothetical protein
MSAREYWLNRVDEVCAATRTRLTDANGNDDDLLRSAAIRSLGLTGLLKRRDAARERLRKAHAAATEVEQELAEAIGVGSHWCVENALSGKIDEEKVTVKERVYRRSPTGRKILDLEKIQKRLRDRVMSARRPKDYDGIEEELAKIEG